MTFPQNFADFTAYSRILRNFLKQKWPHFYKKITEKPLNNRKKFLHN